MTVRFLDLFRISSLSFDVKVKFLAELSCPCADHEGREFLNMVVPMSVDQLFILLFTDSKFFKDFQKNRRATGR